MRISVRVTPRSAKNAVTDFDPEGRLRVYVTAPPTDGQANAAVVEVLAEALGVGRRSLQLVSGATSRTKVFEVADDSPGLASRLAALRDEPAPPPKPTRVR